MLELFTNWQIILNKKMNFVSFMVAENDLDWNIKDLMTASN